jgi:hypothetical protein
MSNVVRFPKIPVSAVSRTPGPADRLPHNAGPKRAVSLNSYRADLIRTAIGAGLDPQSTGAETLDRIGRAGAA